MDKIIKILGLVGGVAAFITAALHASRTKVIAPLAIVAVVLLVWYIVRNARRVGRVTRSRAIQLGIHNTTLVILFLFIVVLTNIIFRQYYFRYDATSAQRFTLAPQSAALTAGLKEGVDVVFYGKEGSSDFERMRALLESYRYVNRNFTYRLLDLDRAPLEAAAQQVTNYGTVVVSSNGRRVSATGSDEATVTNLLVRMTRREAATIGFLETQNDPILGTGRNGFGRIAEKLSALGYLVKPIVASDRREIFKKTGVLVLIDGDRVLTREEVEDIAGFRRGGGKFVVLAEKNSPFHDLLTSLGLSIHGYPTYDVESAAAMNPSVPLVTRYGDGPVTRGFAGGTEFPGVYGIEFVGEGVFVPIALTSPGAWVEENNDRVMEAQEARGQQVIAATVTPKGEDASAAVFGDRDFVSNAYVDQGGNANLFVNTVNWLVGEGRLVSVMPHPQEFIPLFVTAKQADVVRILFPIGMPILFTVVGGAVWLRRRG